MIRRIKVRHCLGIAGLLLVVASPDSARATVWPVSGYDWLPDTITSPYGIRRLSSGVKYHSGIDIRAPNGSATLVFATDAGKVVDSDYHQVKGHWIRIEHVTSDTPPQTYDTDYFHLSSRIAQEGNLVYEGQPIGYAGNTGHSGGIHLHYGYRLSPTAIYKNPMRHLPYADSTYPDLYSYNLPDVEYNDFGCIDRIELHTAVSAREMDLWLVYVPVHQLNPSCPDERRTLADEDVRQPLTPEATLEKINYCHANPVRRGLAVSPGEWVYSSYNWYEGVTDVPIRIDTFGS